MIGANGGAKKPRARRPPMRTASPPPRPGDGRTRATTPKRKRKRRN